MEQQKKYRLIIDSNYLGYVNFFALPMGLSFNGSSTEILYGFLRDIITLARRFETNDFIFCWDSKESKRKDIFPEYKHKRKKEKTDKERETDKQLYRQFDILRNQLLQNLGFMNSFSQEGFEADDLIAQLVLKSKSQKKTIVVSSDHDLYQLLDYCSLYNYRKKETLNKELFTRMYGIEPSQWVRVMELSGCATDDVPGIEGVGPAKAISFIKGEMTKGKVFDRIKTFDTQKKELTRTLVSLPLPGTQTPLLCKNTLRLEKYVRVCNQYGFKSLLSEKCKNDWKKIITF